MMMAEKRSAESSQQKDTFAVCPSCSRLSNNLSSCDRCGTPLSADNAAECYTSQPKRARTDNGPRPTSNDLTNGTSSSVPIRSSPRLSAAKQPTTSNTVSTNGTIPIMNPQPVPQALYMNTSNLATASSNGPASLPNQTPNIRPQALYVNVNNPGVTLPTVMQLSTGTTSGNVQTATMSAPVLSAAVSQSGARPMINNNMVPAAQTQYGMQYPGGSIMTGQPSMMTRPPTLTMATSRAPPSYTNLPTPPSSSNNSPQPNNVKLSLGVSQIRIGLRRFSAAAGVQFKEDGVMFTLKEHQSAPLMVNARAILRCKANMNQPFSAFFFYLEGSCIKQIRQIFSMRDWEFNDKSPVDKVKCISIFPPTISQREAKLIQDSFASMAIKFRRSDRILETINQDSVIDILYGTNTNSLTEEAARAEASHASNQGQSMQQNNRPSGFTTNNSYQQAAQRPTASQMLRSVANLDSRATSSPQSSTHVRGAISNNPATMIARPNANTPTLVIPNDPARWNIMKKTLMVGGVYQVQMQDGQKKYCVWNGTNLQPCLVQDTEVQLKCKSVRIGSLKANISGPIRVQNDNSVRGISFRMEDPTAQGPQGVLIDVFLPYVEIAECLLSTERIQAIFIYPTNPQVQKLRTRLHLNSYQKDPYYNTSSKEERHKHMILFLDGINRDQKEALVKMKVPTSGKSFFNHIDMMRALKILSDIKGNSMVQSKMDDYFGGRKNNEPVDPIDSIMKEFTPKSASKVAEDDDDDDLIMMEEEVGTKCPYTQKEMIEPVRNIICNHNYEKQAIYEFIQRKRLKNIDPKCPYAGCGNTTPLRPEDLVFNQDLQEYIAKKRARTS